jgi:2-methylisocitrate lyase-like PEP mutase family enzyme
MNSFQTFAGLHQAKAPFLLGNCWDVQSAKLLESAGYPAIGFSSHALSTALALGYEDGEQLPFDLVVRMTKRITETIGIPFTVDMEGGYSRETDRILAHIDQLIVAGAAGINLEDTLATPNRHFQPAGEFAGLIRTIADHLSRSNQQLFLNIRTDGFLLDSPTALAETLTRAKLYAAAGASALFVPCITDEDDIRQVVEATTLPVNVMAVPGLPDPGTLQELGVRRISMGPFLFSATYAHAARLAEKVYDERSLKPILY